MRASRKIFRNMSQVPQNLHYTQVVTRVCMMYQGLPRLVVSLERPETHVTSLRAIASPLIYGS